MSLDIFNNVFLLDFALEPTQGPFQGLIILNDDFSHSVSPHLSMPKDIFDLMQSDQVTVKEGMCQGNGPDDRGMGRETPVLPRMGGEEVTERVRACRSDSFRGGD